MRTSGRKALIFLTAAAILCGVVLIITFYAVEMNAIEESAAETLNKTRTSSESFTTEDLPVFFVLYSGDDEQILSSGEKKLLKYYNKNKTRIKNNEVRKLDTKDFSYYYMAMSREHLWKNLSGKGTPIIYVDVTFDEKLVKSTTMILSIVMFFIAVLLYAAGIFTRKTIEKEERTAKTFFENASHELKTPLMIIEGYADGMKKGIVEKDDGCVTISRETERMGKLVSDILEMSKFDSGNMKMDMQLNDIREIIYDGIRMVEMQAQHRGLEVRTEMPHMLITECDERMMLSALSNIMTNGIRYAESFIRVCADTEGKEIVIRIANDGREISEDDRKHIFDRFYKGENGQSGIGMALSKEYIEMHHGSIRVITGGETVFEIKIPCRSA